MEFNGFNWNLIDFGLNLIKNVIDDGGLMVSEHLCILGIDINVFCSSSEYIFGQAAFISTKKPLFLKPFLKKPLPFAILGEDYAVQNDRTEYRKKLEFCQKSDFMMVITSQISVFGVTTPFVFFLYNKFIS